MCIRDSGYAGLALYKQEMQQQTPYVTLVDAGDAIQGAPIGTISDGGYIIEIMNKVGYDFAIPGNHEYDYGMARFMELAGQLRCGYTSCNFMNLASGTTVSVSYTHLDVYKRQPMSRSRRMWRNFPISATAV